MMRSKSKNALAHNEVLKGPGLKGKVKENWNKLVLSLIKAERVRFAKVQH
jgi:hypothetical protein